MTAQPRLRIDKLLWFLRLARTRALAADWALSGHIRCNGQRVTKSAALVAVGDVLTLPLRDRICAVEILAIPARRGPAVEARRCYRDVNTPAATDSQDAAAP